jgi:large subunit ribosomal protein L15e
LRKNYKQIAEERANRVYKNCSVLNSYELAKDGKYAWYEVILVDPAHPQIKADRDLKWIAAAKHRTRAYHGKTSAGRKSRGLHGKGKGYEKAQPSRRANKRLQ